MTLSPRHGADALEASPAPPAFSPLTDQAQPTREPSVDVDLNAPAATEPSALPPNAPNAPDAPSVDQNQVLFNPTALGQLRGALVDSDFNMPLDYSQPPPAPAMTASQQQALVNSLAHQIQAARTSIRPSTIAPAQVMGNGAGHDEQSALDAPRKSVEDTRLESFARIEFADSVFQMTTYAVVIGRDQRALEQAKKDKRRMQKYIQENERRAELGLPELPPPSAEPPKFSKSYVSEEGGMLGPESNGDEDERPAKRRKTNKNGDSVSAGESQPQPSPAEADAPEQSVDDGADLIVNRQYISHTPGATPVNLSALLPSPDSVPFIGIHSPGPDIAAGTKAISRQHLKIQFNKTSCVFEAIPLHRNGFFVDDVHYREGRAVLRSGAQLQIKDVQFAFIINGVPKGKTGAEDNLEDGAANRRYSEGGKEMSFEFESNHGNEKMRSTSPEEDGQQDDRDESDSDGSGGEPMDEDAEAPADGSVLQTIERDAETGQQLAQSPLDLAALAGMPLKKRGPGRPPKNGVMSKRQEREIRKRMNEEAKKNAPPPTPGEPPVKRKVGRPRKHPLPEDGGERPEKRKYKPRKKNGEEGESDPEKMVKERRREKPKTPPLQLRREDYTQEQLQKPNKNYGLLIYEVLSVAPPDGLSLKQIYKRISERYPFFHFAVETKGWESSVRHNLIGNDAFKKNEETHLWSLVPGIDIDAGKKRKAASPDYPPRLPQDGQHHQSPAQGAAFRPDPAGLGRYTQSGTPQHPPFTASNSPSGVAQHPSSQPPQRYPATGPSPLPVPPQIHGPQNTAHQQPVPGASISPYTRTPPVPTPTGQMSATPQPTPASLTNSTPAVPLYPHLPKGTVTNGLPGPSQLGAAQGAASGTTTSQTPDTAAFEPAVAPELITFVAEFKATATEQLNKLNKGGNPRQIVLSAVRRFLKLASASTVQDSDTGVETVVFGVLQSTSVDKVGDKRFLHPKLLQGLMAFKDRIRPVLLQKLGDPMAELIVLSAFDRALGFEKESTLEVSEERKDELARAEGVLLDNLGPVIEGYQKKLASTT
ncbi:hypothetical protein QBC47DRAFT_384455 [Echria macrotheca]|uniref:Uncharacterized protein n=1 Tax=Echria macrotheca TaxID=438768 RepID=A0AAJ0BC91_9PEZI|nr:hypothetical protein QBC47DRAFT_384455 [Echria macrotheca]